MDTATTPATSDSAEARREARRRRILENSSNRLAKISGIENPIPAQKPTTSTREPNDSKPAAAASNIPIVHDDPEIERDVYVPPASLLASSSSSTTSPFIDPMQQFRFGAGGGGAGGPAQADLFANMFAGMNTSAGGGFGSGDAANNPFAMFQGFANASALDGPSLFSGDLFASLAGSAGGAGNPQASTAAAAPPLEKLSLIVRLLRAKLHIAAIGTLTYLLAANDLMFRSHVFTLFLLWEAVELFVLKPYEKDRSSYLGIVFLVSGIPTEHSSVVMRWLSTIRRVLKDVAIFVFFFVLAHVVWQALVLGESMVVVLNVEEGGAEGLAQAAGRRLVEDYVPRRTLVVESDVDADVDFEF